MYVTLVDMFKRKGFEIGFTVLGKGMVRKCKTFAGYHKPEIELAIAVLIIDKRNVVSAVGKLNIVDDHFPICYA